MNGVFVGEGVVDEDELVDEAEDEEGEVGGDRLDFTAASIFPITLEMLCEVCEDISVTMSVWSALWCTRMPSVQRDFLAFRGARKHIPFQAQGYTGLNY